MNVHCLEDDLAIYPGVEEEIVKLLIGKGVGIYQIPCPEIELSSIFRKPLPKDSYEHEKIRKVYRELSETITDTLSSYVRKGYEITAVIGAEGSPTCGVDTVGKWKDNIQGKKEFPRDIEFIPGSGVFIEEFKTALAAKNINPHFIGTPGKSLRTIDPSSFDNMLERLEQLT